MKKLTILLSLVIATSCFSQEFTSASEQPQQLDEFGNFLNNITDKNGEKQGDWFFQDFNGTQAAKKTYKNNVCQQTLIKVSGDWVNTNDLSNSQGMKTGAIADLKSNGIGLNNNRQLLVILDKSGQLSKVWLLGNWSSNEATKVSSLLKAYFSKQDISSSTYSYLIL
jgi:hypothetical protein